MTAYFRSATAARDMHERYRALLSRWPVANTQLTATTRVGGTLVDVLLDTEETRRRVVANLPHAAVQLIPRAPHYLKGQAEPVLRCLLASSGASND